MIEVKGLTKRYRDRAAIEGLSFELKEGDILGFLGPNGAGKTTTMRVLAGFLPATSGSAKVAGFDVFEQPLEVKRRLGYLPEQPPLYPDMTVGSYLRFCAEVKGIASKGLKAEIDRVARLTRVDDVLGRVIANLSKGYRQRVGLAQAIIGSPPVLILDEPTVGLDPLQIIEVRDLVRDLAASGKHTIILSTHILQEVTELCRKVLVIKSGKLVDFDTIEGLRSRHVDGKELSLEEIYLRLIDPTGELRHRPAEGATPAPQTPNADAGSAESAPQSAGAPSPEPAPAGAGAETTSSDGEPPTKAAAN
ncbi:MAG TPA: multidrug ABC transporter ATP-binding protein [Myxococcales bacterium]|nr:multidrug ABC transporter ATP-binding protein [Myxococcales bacterium]